MKIRSAVEADAAAMAAAHYSAVHTSAVGSYPAAILDIWSPLPSEARHEVFRRAMRGGRELFLVAQEASGVVGFGSIIPSSNELRSVYVQADHGRRGVGSALLEQLEVLAAARGCSDLEFNASLNAESFYVRNGYVVIGRGFQRLPAGLEMACVTMRKRLSSSLQRYYAARAPEYDRVYLKPERQLDLRAIELWVRESFAKTRVLEIACGTGYWTRHIAAVAACVRATDLTPETLAIAKRRVAATHVEFVIGDAYAPARSAGQFDAAFAGFWFSHVPISRRDEFLRNLSAALGPGAKVALLDNRFVEGSSSAIADRDAEGNSYQLRRLSDGTNHRVLKNFPSEAELLSVAQCAGRNARVTQWQYYWALEYVTASPGLDARQADR
jgi:demethylmenaquinone methyltransferase/2-methoxy-6-polyprenyl-1,4-benzoquinol methylase